MLVACLAFAAVSFGLWFTYMIRYPKKWGALIDGVHENLRPYGLSFAWMRTLEKGLTLKVLVVATTVVILCCIAVLLRHPTALTDFLREYSHMRPE